MPTYEYECTKCGHKFEFFQKMSDEPLTECPECKSFVKRLIGNGAGIIFKGPGFYATDYRKKTPDGKARTCPNTGRDNPACKSCDAKNENK